MGRNVPSVALRPARPNWKSIVGVHFPKSAPARLVVELVAAVVAAVLLLLVAEPVLALVLALVLAPEQLAELELEAVLVLAADAVELFAELEAPALDLLPLASTLVKLLKPCAIITSATERPVASNGVVSEVAELAFSVSDPVTAGSTRGTIPRSSCVAGRVASPQIEGISTLKGLKFCSAATTAAAPLMTAGSVPKVVTILSARVS